MDGGATALVHGEVRELDPPRLLVMTWYSPEFPQLETLLSFELEPAAGGTRLTLRHSGLTEPGSLQDHQHGWLEALSLLLPWIAMIAAAGPRDAQDA